MKLVRTILLAAALAGVPALAMAQSNATAGTAAGAPTGGVFAGPAGAFAGGVFGGATGAAAGAAAGGAAAGPAGAFLGGMFGGATGAAADVAGAPFYEGRSVYVGPSAYPYYAAPGPVYVMPEDAPLQRRCWVNVYGERQCESFR